MITAPASVVALGLDDGAAGFAWIRDTQNKYGSGVGPGDVAHRTIAGVTVGLRRLRRRDLPHRGPRPVGRRCPWTTPIWPPSARGTLTVHAARRSPATSRSRSSRSGPALAGSAGDRSTSRSPAAGRSRSPKSIHPDAPPVGSGYTFVGNAATTITAPAADTTANPIVARVHRSTRRRSPPGHGPRPDGGDRPRSSGTASRSAHARRAMPDDPASPNPCVNLRETLPAARIKATPESSCSAARRAAGPSAPRRQPPRRARRPASRPCAGDAQAGVSWTAPADDGDSPITGYTVTSSPGG